MPAQFVINGDYRVVFSRGAGILTFSDIDGHMDRLTSDPRFNPDFNQIFDFTEVTELALTVNHIKQLAKRNIFSPKSRRAYVVTEDLHFGLSRMFASLHEAEGEPGIIVFREMPPAIIWADVPAEVAQKAFTDLREQYQPA
jgi:hypothetical protein